MLSTSVGILATVLFIIILMGVCDLLIIRILLLVVLGIGIILLLKLHLRTLGHITIVSKIILGILDWSRVKGSSLVLSFAVLYGRLLLRRPIKVAGSNGEFLHINLWLIFIWALFITVCGRGLFHVLELVLIIIDLCRLYTIFILEIDI